MASCAAKIIWLIGLYAELGVKINLFVKLVCVSKAVIQIAVNPIFHERIKHISIDYHFVREKLCEGVLKTEHVHHEDHLADLLTKSLGRAQQEYLSSQLGLKNMYQPST